MFFVSVSQITRVVLGKRPITLHLDPEDRVSVRPYPKQRREAEDRRRQVLDIQAWERDIHVEDVRHGVRPAPIVKVEDEWIAGPMGPLPSVHDRQAQFWCLLTREDRRHWLAAFDADDCGSVPLPIPLTLFAGPPVVQPRLPVPGRRHVLRHADGHTSVFTFGVNSQ
jgi:hypothetical protein